MKVHNPKLYSMAHLSLNVFTASKGSNNYILFDTTGRPRELNKLIENKFSAQNCYEMYRFCETKLFVHSGIHGYQTVKCRTAVKKGNPIHILPVLRVRCSKR